MQIVTDFDLAICGIEELPDHGAQGVSHVVSILDPEHPLPDAFAAYNAHARLELRFHDVIEETSEQVAPQADDIARILAFGGGLSAEGRSRLLVHCHAGISRSTAAMALILAQAHPDQPAAVLLQHILAQREKAWPNLRMLELGDALLGRADRLADAAPVLYRHQLDIRPHLADIMRRAGRGREIDTAGL
jgi:predicted protein tyrosine phosphatase